MVYSASEWRETALEDFSAALAGGSHWARKVMANNKGG
jgi:hypothetical protein